MQNFHVNGSKVFGSYSKCYENNVCECKVALWAGWVLGDSGERKTKYMIWGVLKLDLIR